MTPAAYLLPSAMSLSRRAATRGSTTPMRIPLLIAISRLSSGIELDVVAGVDLGQLARVGEVGQEGEPGLAGLLDEDADRGLAALLGRHGLLAGGHEQHLEPVDVALGDAVGRVERQGRLVVLARGPELAQLPERLGEPVLGLGVRTELEELAVRRRGVGPLGRGGVGDGLVGQLALLAGQVDGALGGGLDVGREGHEAVVLSGRGEVRADRVRGARPRRKATARASLSSTVRSERQTKRPLRARADRFSCQIFVGGLLGIDSGRSEDS